MTEDLIREFVMAAHGNAARVAELLSAHPELRGVRYVDFNETALEAASHMGRRDIAHLLLEAGEPLILPAALMLGDLEAARGLLDAKPELIHSAGAHGIPLMFHAAISGNPVLADLLWERGNRIGLGAAVHAAVAWDQPEFFGWLQDHEAPLDAPDHEGNTPLQAAQQRGQTDWVERLQGQSDVGPES
ncbi:ankyrin repeat domain-containing protein [Deinococcus cellulosilyticus]|nr:ankyrin repeat domain-containing protein [Deinococcus cellulosilyticus]